MRVVSLGSLDNDGVDYHMFLERPYSQPGQRLGISEREGNPPLITRADPQILTLALHVVIYEVGKTDAQVRALREALLSELDTRSAAIPLVVEDNDETFDRYRYVVVQSVDEQPSSEGLGQEFVATMATYDEQRWRLSAAQSASLSATASGQSVTVNNPGSAAVRPVFTFHPTSQKNGSNQWEFRQFVAIRWPSWTAYRRYPIDLTDASWDTDALVTAGEIYAPLGEDNIGVMVDGQEVRRWINGYDTTTTSVWANIDMAPKGITRLRAAIGSGDSLSSLTVEDWGIQDFPDSGMFVIDEEVFTYSGKNDLTYTFFNVARASKGSVAAAHLDGSYVEWLQHEVWLLWGGNRSRETTFWDNPPNDGTYDVYKPMFDLTTSSNSHWKYIAFAGPGADYAYRVAAWRPTESPGHRATGIGDPYGQIEVGRLGRFEEILIDVEGTPDTSWWSVQLAFTMQLISASGYSTQHEAYEWNVFFDFGWGQSYQLRVPQPANLGVAEWFSESMSLPHYEANELRFAQECGGSMQSAVDTVDLYFLNSPYVSQMAAIETYSLGVTLLNSATGESIDLNVEMAVGDYLVVDTANHTVRLLSDGSNQYQALSRSTRRQEMLTLVPGDNLLVLTEAGLTGLSLTVSFEALSYS